LRACRANLALRACRPGKTLLANRTGDAGARSARRAGWTHRSDGAGRPFRTARAD
jgi:hypothetical protein